MFNLFQLAVIVLCVSETLSARVKGRRKRKIGGSGNSEPGIDFTDCINDPETGEKYTESLILASLIYFVSRLLTGRDHQL